MADVIDTREHSKAECPHSNVSKNLTDTREKLEADVLAHYKTPEEKLKTVREWLDRQAAITERECMEQATTRYIGWDCAECAEGLGKELDARCDPLKERIAELTAERDHFRKHVNHLMALIADIARKQPYTFDPEAPYMTLDTIGDYLDELQDRVDSLTAEVEAQRKRANDAERGVLNGGWYVCRDKYEDDIAELTVERDQLSRDLTAEHALVVQFEHDNEELIAERDRLQMIVQIQADSFQKLERELKEALDGKAE